MSTPRRANTFLVDVDNTLLADLLGYDLDALLDAADHNARQLAPAQRER